MIEEIFPFWHSGEQSLDEGKIPYKINGKVSISWENGLYLLDVFVWMGLKTGGLLLRHLNGAGSTHTQAVLFPQVEALWSQTCHWIIASEAGWSVNTWSNFGEIWIKVEKWLLLTDSLCPPFSWPSSRRMDTLQTGKSPPPNWNVFIFMPAGLT